MQQNLKLEKVLKSKNFSIIEIYSEGFEYETETKSCISHGACNKYPDEIVKYGKS